ncbi:MAG: DUF1837 domain-containing protein [Alphaproteobacteria bacterium]|nr:DUF1837 domain-containing protein [Alphaproteobacteria bacterium]MBQ6861733.1 DUF1837 domain-containing protein [Alistipes sp.]
MLIRTDIQSNFLNLFTKILENYDLEYGNKLNAFMLKISNNQFNYGGLSEELQNALITYALSRHTCDELIKQQKYGNLSAQAREKLKAAENNTGELGELLLYCLLESHLQAPKLLTKLELKTAANDYVKGADGVHLLKIDDTSYQIVFGESKLHADLQSGITSAFKSIKTMLDNGLDKMRYEIHLVNANLLKETIQDENSYEILKKILIPSENDEDLNIDNSFGVFLGFDIPISDDERRVSNSEFRNNILEKIKTRIFDIVPTINEILKDNKFAGYNFYFYIVPFSELAKVRVNVIDKLKQ